VSSAHPVAREEVIEFQQVAKFNILLTQRWCWCWAVRPLCAGPTNAPAVAGPGAT